jgi:hypothetical protein
MRRTTLKARLFIIGAALAGCTALGIAGATAASASVHGVKPMATNACASDCVDIGFVNPGLGEAILASHSGKDTTGNVVRLVQGSNGMPKSDFAATEVGDVDPLYCTHGGQAQTGSLFTANQCHLLIAEGYGHDETYQLAFDPNNGGPEDQCIGSVGPKSGDKVRLEPCGVNADTVIIVAENLPGGHVVSAGTGWLVSGASDSFSNPNVLTSNGTFPSDPTWTKVDFNGLGSTDTQEACAKDGPFSGPVCV